MISSVDSTSIVFYYHGKPDMYNTAVYAINDFRLNETKGSLTLYFDGSGRVSRVTKTVDI